MDKVLKDYSIDELAKELFNMTTSEAHAKGICINCKGKAIDKCYTDLGKKEYEESGICEECNNLEITND